MRAQLDHLVVDVHDRLDEAERRWRALGFRVTPRGRHSLGSANHLIIFDTDYLELLGWEPQTAPRDDLKGFPIGLNGLVFRDANAEATYADMTQRGLPMLPPRSFHRPVELDDGSSAGDASFTTTRMQPRHGFDGRTYFCQHHTPDLVWRNEWRQHPNTAFDLFRVVIAATDPARPTAMLEAMFGGVTAGALPLARARVEVQPHEALGELLPEAGGRADFLALVGIRVRSLAACEAALRAGGLAFVREGATLRVAPAETMNVALEFSA